MEDLENIRTGATPPDSIRFASPIREKQGDALWDWYKYAPDAGGYFVHGLWLAPHMNWDLYPWLWDLGVPSGGLKDVNNGARYWGYVQDGLNKNITKGMTASFPDSGMSDTLWGVAITLWGSSNMTDERGFKVIDFGEHPVVIKFLDGRFDDCEFAVSTSKGSVAMVSEDKRTVTISRVGQNHIAVFLYPKDRSLVAVQQSMRNVYANVSGLTVHTEETDAPVDPSTQVCWDAYAGSARLWHRNRTVRNCWQDLGLLKEETGTTGETAYTRRSFVRGDNTKIPTLDILDDIYTEEKDASGNVTSCVWQQFNGKTNNRELLEAVREWFSTHTLRSALPLGFGRSNHSLGLFCESDMDGTLTLNISEPYMSAVAPFNGSSIEEIHINKGVVTSLHDFFYGARQLRRVVLEHDARSHDLSGAFEFCGNLLELPSVHWGDGNTNDRKVPNSNIGYAFEYCSRLEAIPRYGTERESADNTLTASLAPQAFNQCVSLKSIDPILDFRYVRPNGAPLVFAGCTALTDARIRNLNHGSWAFDGTAIGGVTHGVLSGLDSESVKYLFQNLHDLTVTEDEDEDSVSEVRTAELHCPSTWGDRYYPFVFTQASMFQVDKRTYNTVKISDIQNKTKVTSNVYVSISRFTDLRIKVEGITENVVIGIGAGTYTAIQNKITEDGIYSIDTGTNPWAIKLYSLIADDGKIETPVTITLLPGFDNDTIKKVNAKGWKIFVNDVEQVVTN